MTPRNALHEKLDELYRLHKASREFEHGIREGGGDWRFFQPTQFIYAFFTFNSIYNLDWRRSFAESLPRDWEREFNPGSGRNEYPTEEERFRALLDACYGSLGQDADARFRGILRCALTTEDPVQALAGIRSDGRTADLRKSFRKAFRRVYAGEREEGCHQGEVAKLLLFVYKVRCNIFHGSKTVEEMSQPDQRERLAIYTAILLAMNETFFWAAAKATGWCSRDYAIQCFSAE